jgi:hypothetical protein
MKINYRLYILLMVFAIGCYKATPDKDTYSVSYTIYCAAPDHNFWIRTDDTRLPFSNTKSIHYYGTDGSGLWNFGLAGNKPSTISVYKADDSVNAIYSQVVDGKPGERYNLMIYGRQDDVHTLLLEHTPAKPLDSVSNVRFFNFASDFPNISINLAGQPAGSEVESLAYTEYTAHKSYSAKSGSNEYVLEFIDKSTGDIIFTQPFIAIPFANTNICIRGYKDAWPPLEVSIFSE